MDTNDSHLTNSTIFPTLNGHVIKDNRKHLMHFNLQFQKHPPSFSAV